MDSRQALIFGEHMNDVINIDGPSLDVPDVAVKSSSSSPASNETSNQESNDIPNHEKTFCHPF
eukprot:12296530-Ditylum_brightwellii.AAC.1